MPTLYIVATPIGNLEDITLRALRVLSEVDFILCEDTRVTRKLLEHYNIKTPTVSYHQHSDLKKTEYILVLLSEGKNLALVSDAGTPGISDPGGKLVQKVFEKFSAQGGKTEVSVESVPGPSAVTAALSISGIPTDKFIFLGFPPHKKGRQSFLDKIAESEYPVIVYESKHRIVKFLEELTTLEKRLQGAKGEKNKESGEMTTFKYIREKAKGKKREVKFTSVVVAREISKMHETVYRGELKNIIELVKSSPEHQKGEFTVIIGK